MSTATRYGALAAALLIASTVSAQAHKSWPREIQRERDRQADAIQQGRHDGSLTWLERYGLRREQKRIAKMERAALADGRLTRREFRSIRHAQKDAARHIYRQRHNARVRGWWWRAWY